MSKLFFNLKITLSTFYTCGDRKLYVHRHNVIDHPYHLEMNTCCAQTMETYKVGRRKFPGYSKSLAGLLKANQTNINIFNAIQSLDICFKR